MICVSNMGSLSGILQRPFFAVTAVAVASFSSDFSDKLPSQRSPDAAASSSTSPDLSNNSTFDFLKESKTLFASHISVSKLANLSFVTKIHAPVPNINFPIPTSSGNYVRNFHTSLVSSPVLSNLYQSAALTKASKQAASSHKIFSPPSEVMYRWHLPEPTSLDISGSSACSVAKSRTVVVLLGWLGAKQKHLKRYAEWYTSRGFHAITFTFPMSEILTYQIGGKVEQHVDLLVNHLADWLEEEHGKNLVFHTFSNTGWLTYVFPLSPSSFNIHTTQNESLVLLTSQLAHLTSVQQPSVCDCSLGFILLQVWSYPGEVSEA